MKRSCSLMVYTALFLSLCLAGNLFSESKKAFASVTINNKTLNEINDIVLETTGNRVIKKESLLKVMKTADGKFRFYPLKGNDDGSQLSEGSVQYLNVDGGKTNTGVHPAVSKKRNSDGSLVLMVPSAPSNSNGIKVTFFNVNIDANSNITQSKQWDVYFATNRSNVYINDGVSGIFPDGENGREIFAISYFTADSGNRPGSAIKQVTSYVALIDFQNRKYYEHRIGYMNACYPSIRISTGDFNQDGKSSELAIMRDGRGGDYYMQVFNVPSADRLNEFYHASLGNRPVDDSDNIEGCDVIAGDFNGDGKTNLAVVYADKKDYDGRPTIMTFKWNGSSFTQSAETDYNDDLWLGSSHIARSSHVPHFGIIAEAGDLDGNGTDEIVFLSAKYAETVQNGDIITSVWGTDNNLKPSKKCHFRGSYTLSGYGGVAGAAIAESSYLERSLSLALVPIGEKLNTGGVLRRIFISKCEGDDSVQKSSDYITGDSYCSLKAKMSNGSITGLEIATKPVGGSAGRAMLLVPGDFYFETLELEDPTHFVFEDERVYTAEVQVPPYHVDFCTPSFINRDHDAVTNLTFIGATSSYSNSKTETNKQDIAFNMSSTLDFGIESKTEAHAKILGATLAGGYSNVAKKVESGSNSHASTISTQVSSTIEESDNIVMYTTDRHVWRYPIKTPVYNPTNQTYDEKFMTFSMCDTPAYSSSSGAQSSQLDDYNPIHEEGNLFSYPTLVENTPYYGERVRDLSLIHHITINAGTSNNEDLTITDLENDTSSFQTVSDKKINGSLNMSLGDPTVFQTSVGVNASYAKSLSNTNTYTKTYQNTEKFIINLPKPQLPFLASNIAHQISSQLYSDAAGVMKVAFAVNLVDGNAPLWREDEIYGSKSDPALVLPGRFGRFNNIIENVGAMTWTAQTDWILALKLRGISFWDDLNQETTSRIALVRGRKYKISIPIYNASFVAPENGGNVDVDIRLMKGTCKAKEFPDVDSLTLLGRRTVKLGGWTKDTENNKAKLEFDWEIPSNYEEGNYELFFVIDPDDRINEIHERWASKDIIGNIENQRLTPAGNNVGYYPIAIIAKEPEIKIAFVSNKKIKKAATEENFKIYFAPVRKSDTRTELTLDEFREELSHKRYDFVASGRVIYTGDETLTNLFLRVSRTKDNNTSRISSRIIPAIFANSEYTFSFVVSPEKIFGSKFDVQLVGDNAKLEWINNKVIEYSGEYEDESNTNTNITYSGGSSSGCNFGLSGLSIMLLALLAVKREK